MALNGIDAQIMIQRTADYSKDAANSARRGELMGEYASAMLSADVEAEIKTVTRREKADKALFGREENPSGRDLPEEGKEKREDGREVPETAEEPRAEGGRFIDITL